MQDAKEEIRARLSVEDVVGQYVELKRAGRNLKGRSPWGVDKTPSFMVSPEKGIWHDFSANKGGDIFTFVMEVEGISFREALEKLAARAGVELEKYQGGDRQLAERKRRAKEILELTTKLYQYCLDKSPKASRYVREKRCMSDGTIDTFRIGYAPNNGKALYEFLIKRGYTREEMDAAGVLNRFGGDLFRGRMMVPFIDANGVIGFTARILDQGEPKYLNTPDTLLFNKSRFVFGLAQAKEAIRRSNFIVIVEGNMDVISSHQAGVREAVATSGTAMTEQHLKILSRLSNDIRLAYDGDEAGIKATERAIMLAGDLGINLSVISDYHGAKDPDELIQKDPKLWQQSVQKCRPAVNYLLKKYEENIDLNSGPGKRQYSDIAMKLLTYISDPVERKHYEQEVADAVKVEVEDLHKKKIKTSTKIYKKPVTNIEADVLVGIKDNIDSLILYGEVKNIVTDFNPEEVDQVRREELEMIFEQQYQGWDKESLAEEAKKLLKRYKVESNKRKVSELAQQLKEAEEAGDKEKEDELIRQIAVLKRT